MGDYSLVSKPKLRIALFTEVQRNRELTRQVEQLIATVREVIECKSLGGYTADYMRERIGAALAEFTAPTSSAPSDDRADTGREET